MLQSPNTPEETQNTSYIPSLAQASPPDPPPITKRSKLCCPGEEGRRGKKVPGLHLTLLSLLQFYVVQSTRGDHIVPTNETPESAERLTARLYVHLSKKPPQLPKRVSEPKTSLSVLSQTEQKHFHSVYMPFSGKADS